MNQVNEKLENWIQHQLGKTVQKTSSLKGGVSSVISHHLLDDQSSVVSRHILNKEWLAEEPDLIIHEQASLLALSREHLPVPIFLAADADANECDAPSLLMSTLPGKPQLERSVYEAGMSQLAKTLSRIHQTPIPADFHWDYAPYTKISEIKIPKWTTNPNDWEEALHFVRHSTPFFIPVFIHRDYHPTNILWEEEKLSGVVDWINACRGPSLVDVAHCRMNLALLYGVEMADSFLKAYLHAHPIDYNPYWDILSVFDFVDEEMDVYEGWTDLGHTELSSSLMKLRADEYVRHVCKFI